MKSTSEILSLLSDYKNSSAQKYGLTKIGIFGSVARGEHTEDSDVDICIEMTHPDMFSMVHIKEDLQALLGITVDIVRIRANMNPVLLKQIRKDGVYA